MNVIKSSDGVLLNIGGWDYQIDDDGNVGNPLPDGAIEADEEVVTGFDGGLYLSTDPRAGAS